MFGIVSTGPSSIAIDLTYDRQRLTEAIKKISGAGSHPRTSSTCREGQQGPPEVRYRAHVAFSTAYDMMRQLEAVHNRRKAFIYVSNGYDFDPFAKTRAKNEAERYGMLRDNVDSNDGSSDGSNNSVDPNDPTLRKSGNEFAFADLVSDLAELTRAANRANATIYTIDPRGLVGGPDLDEKIDMMECQDYVRSSQDSLRVLAELTGGLPSSTRTTSRRRSSASTTKPATTTWSATTRAIPDPTEEAPRDRSQGDAAGRRTSGHRTSYTLKTPPESRRHDRHAAFDRTPASRPVILAGCRGRSGSRQLRTYIVRPVNLVPVAGEVND